jgi:HEAT repeat protein
MRRLLLLCWVLGMFSAEGMALSPPPPDTRPWAVAYASFFNPQSTGNRSDDAVRLFALDPEKTVLLLLRALERQQPEELRWQAIWGLSSIRSPAGLEPLLQVAGDAGESIRIRSSAIFSLASLQETEATKDPRVTKLCLDLLNQKNRDLLNATAYAVALEKSPDGIRAIRNAFESAPTNQLASLIHALMVSGDPEASAFVFRNVPAPAASESDSLCVSYTLLMMKQPIREAEPFMTKLLHGKSSWFKSIAFEYFKTFPNEYVAQDLLKALDETKYSPAYETNRAEIIDAFIAAPLVSERTKEKLRQKNPIPQPDPFAGFSGQ